jgi:hypothetical protein
MSSPPATGVVRALVWSALAALPAAAGPPDLLVGPFGPPRPLQSGRDVCFSMPPDLNDYLASSEIIGEYEVETRLANAFSFPNDETICLARWWGGYYSHLNGCSENAVDTFHLYFYQDLGCLPTGEPFSSFLVTPAITYVDCQSPDYPIYQYEASIELSLRADVTYWFVAQAADHEYPPQWGRLGSADDGPCAYGAFWGPYFGFPEWGIACDLAICVNPSAEFECACHPVPVLEGTWGGIKSLYR